MNLQEPTEEDFTKADEENYEIEFPLMRLISAFLLVCIFSCIISSILLFVL